MFRGMARLVGAATVGAAAVPTAGAFCHAHPPVSTSMREQENFSAMLNHSQKGSFDLNINPKDFGPSVDVRFEQEECECSLAEKEEGGPTLRRLVFSPPPTEEEVEEATKELHAALHLSIPTQGSPYEEEQPESTVGVASREDHMDITPEASDKRVTTSSFMSFNHLGTLAAENSSVMQAFQLLQTNPKVQDVVKSLACDPAVWNAVLSNEKVLELTQEDSESYNNDDSTFLESKESGEVTLTSKLYGLVMTRTKVYYSCVKGKVFSILNSMFGSMEKTIFSKEGRSTKDKTVASCMMLAVAVLIVVVMRRSLTRHYA